MTPTVRSWPIADVAALVRAVMLACDGDQRAARRTLRALRDARSAADTRLVSPNQSTLELWHGWAACLATTRTMLEPER